MHTREREKEIGEAMQQKCKSDNNFNDINDFFVLLNDS
jgi:hypothetical protein